MDLYVLLSKYREVGLYLNIAAGILLACSYAFYFVTTMMKSQNDQGDSTGDRFYYVQSFDNLVERDSVDKAFDIHMYDDDLK